MYTKNMKYNCCVPGCNNSHRNRSAALKFYCIPKDPELRILALCWRVLKSIEAFV